MIYTTVQPARGQTSTPDRLQLDLKWRISARADAQTVSHHQQIHRPIQHQTVQYFGCILCLNRVVLPAQCSVSRCLSVFDEEEPLASAWPTGASICICASICCYQGISLAESGTRGVFSSPDFRQALSSSSHCTMQ